MSTTPVTIYSLATCGWSRKAKAFFRKRRFRFCAIEYDMAGPGTQRKVDAEMREHGVSGYPCVKIGSHVVKGYDPTSFERFPKHP